MRAAIGIDVGGTKLLAVALSEDGTILRETTSVASPTTRAGLRDALVDATLDALGGLAPTDELVGVGFGLPGLLDRAGVLHETPNLRSAAETDIGRDLAPAVRAAVASARGDSELRVVAENDATCAAAGELVFGAARHYADVLVVTIGTGIGGGLVVGGRLALGAQGFAGEIGHMVVVTGGALCACGGRGCWEQYASGTGIARLARERVAAGGGARLLSLSGGGADAIRSEHVVAAALEGDAAAREVLDEAARFLALGFSNLAEILDPAAIVISGGLATEEAMLLAPMRAHFSTFRRGSGARSVSIVRAELGPSAGAAGAAAFALDRC